jgi:hypothetical protein
MSIILIYLLGFSEKTSFMLLNNTKKFQEYFIFNTLLLSSIILFTFSYFYYKKIDISFFCDIKTYISITLEIISFKLAQYNYRVQKNYTLIAFSQMSTIWLILPVSYVLNKIFIYNNAITIHNNLRETIFFSTLFFILSMIYFYDKIKLKNIKKPIQLVALGLSLTFTIYFGVKNVQEFQGITYWSMILLSISLIYLINILSDKNFKKKIYYAYTRKNIFRNGLYAMSYIFTVIIALYIMLYVSVQYFALFKRNAQMITGLAIDKYKLKKSILIKDYLIIFLLFVSTIGYMVYKNSSN